MEKRKSQMVKVTVTSGAKNTATAYSSGVNMLMAKRRDTSLEKAPFSLVPRQNFLGGEGFSYFLLRSAERHAETACSPK